MLDLLSIVPDNFKRTQLVLAQGLLHRLDCVLNTAKLVDNMLAHLIGRRHASIIGFVHTCRLTVKLDCSRFGNLRSPADQGIRSSSTLVLELLQHTLTLLCDNLRVVHCTGLHLGVGVSLSVVELALHKALVALVLSVRVV